jgi:hypothetical protein
MSRPYLSEENVREILKFADIEYPENPETKRVTLKAFAISDIQEKFKHLKRLEGLDLKASTVLLMYHNPNKYAQLTHDCWNNLVEYHGFNYSKKEIHSDYGIPEYMAYLNFLNEAAQEYGMSLSDIEYVISRM